MGFFEEVGIPALVACALAAAILLVRYEVASRRRNQDRVDRLVAELRPARLYRVRARVPGSGLRQIGMHHLVDHLNGLDIDHTPPQADDADEVELAWTVLATSDLFAERQAARQLERANLQMLALRIDHQQLA